MYRTVILSLFVVIGLLGGHVQAEAETITLAADVWCPYNCDPASDKPGFAVEFAKYAFERKGYTVSYQTMPWERAIADAREGKYNAIIGAYKEDAPDFIYPDHEVFLSGNDFFVKAGDPWVFKDISSLESVTLGVTRGYSYGEDLDAYIKPRLGNLTRVQAMAGDEALERNIKKLLAGRVNVLVEDGAVMSYALKRLGHAGKIVSVGNLGKDKAYIAFSPKLPESPEYAAILSDGIKDLQESGQMKTILAKYGL